MKCHISLTMNFRVKIYHIHSKVFQGNGILWPVTVTWIQNAKLLLKETVHQPCCRLPHCSPTTPRAWWLESAMCDVLCFWGWKVSVGKFCLVCFVNVGLSKRVERITQGPVLMPLSVCGWRNICALSKMTFHRLSLLFTICLLTFSISPSRFIFLSALHFMNLLCCLYIISLNFSALRGTGLIPYKGMD